MNRLDARITVALAQATIWQLEAELARRAFRPDETAVVLGDLVVDPVSSRITRGLDVYELAGRKMESVYALALARRDGHWRVPVQRLGRLVFRGFDPEAAKYNVRSTVHDVNARIPGLILLSGLKQLGYGLSIAQHAAARASA